MAPRLKTGKHGHGEAARADTASTASVNARRAGIPKGSGASAVRGRSQAVARTRAELLESHRRGSGAG